MSDIRFCLLFGTVCFIAGNSMETWRGRMLWHVGAFVFWVTAAAIGFGLTK